MDRPDGVPRAREARKSLDRLGAIIDPFGWEEKVGSPVEVTLDEDEFRDWAVGAFDSARERLGGGSIARDRDLLDEAQALIPLIESLEEAVPA
jgi:hypothetical protein